MPKGVYVHSELQLASLKLGRKHGRVKGALNVKKKKPKNWKRQEARRQKREDKRVDQRSDELLNVYLGEEIEKRAKVKAEEIIAGAQVQVAVLL